MGIRIQYILALFLALMLAVPTSVSAVSRSEMQSIHEPDHIADSMPGANMTLIIRDGGGAHLCTLRVGFSFGTAWHNLEERTGLHMGLYVQWLSAQVETIQFDSVVFRWYATEYGAPKFDYIMDREFSLSHNTLGWGFAGIANYYLTPTDVTTVGIVGGTIELVDVTFTSALGSACSGPASKLFGCNFTNEGTTWQTTTFDINGTTITQDVEVVSYSLQDALPLGFIASLPSLEAIGTIGFLLFIGGVLFLDGRRSSQNLRNLRTRQDEEQDSPPED